MKTNYEGHDQVYQQLKAEGKEGWNKTEAAYNERITMYESSSENI